MASADPIRLTTPRPAAAILVAEDNRTVGRVIRKILEKEGYKVHNVADGHAALDALLNRRLDLALLDADLSGMNAMEVTSLYRFASIGRPHLPILGLIGEWTAPMLAAWVDAGLDGCIGKPIEPTEVREAVSSCLGPHPARERPALSAEDVGHYPALDPRVLRDLEKLGGQAFIDEVITQFMADAARLLPDLSASAAAGDTGMLRDHIHALRSCAGNVGAMGLYNMCLAWCAMGPRELVSNGSEYVTRLEAEFERAVSALDRREWRGSQAMAGNC